MKQQLIKMTGAAIALFLMAVLPLCAATDTVLQLYKENVVKFTVEDGVWTTNGVFATRNGNRVCKGLASDGRRVFIGELGGAYTTIREFDLEGNLTRTLASTGDSVDHMGISRDGKWLYANVGVLFGSSPTTNAAVHRYNAVTGEGGLFIPNTATNEFGTTLWKFQLHRGIAEDELGNLWISERSSGTLYKFTAADGSYLGKITGLNSIQGLYYHADDRKLYCTTSGSNTYIVDVTYDTWEEKSMAEAELRLSITNIEGTFYSGRWDTGDICAYDFDNLSVTTAYDPEMENPNELITIPRAPLRKKLGELLISETISNRVTRLAFDESYACAAEGTLFAGGEGITYNGTPLRQPRGLVAYSNIIYVAEGVAGGRILRFSKWGTFKNVALDFSESAYPECIPAALAVSPNGHTLYVTDAHTLYIESTGNAWENVMPNGFLNANTYGATVYQVAPHSHSVSVFVDSNNLPAGAQLVEPRGIAVDGDGNVYFTSWYNSPTQLYDKLGRIYYYNSAGVMQAVTSTGNPSACYFDPKSVYNPPSINSVTPGPGIINCEYGAQDMFLLPAGSDMTTRTRIMDNSYWRTYLDVEVINEELWYTDPVFGILFRRSGYNARVEEVKGLATPTYMTFIEVTGEEPPPFGTVIIVQ